MFFALMAAASIAAQSSEGQSDQWLCDGSARTARGSDVSIQFYVDAEGNIIAHSTAWDPPLNDRKTYARRRSADMPSMSISYDKADGDGMGLPTGINVSALSERSLRWLDDSTVTMVVPDGPTQTSEFNVSGNHPPYRSATIAGNGDGELLAAVDNSSAVLVNLRDRKNKLIGSISYNVSAKDKRDRLYRQAWAEAHAALRNRSKCEKLPKGGKSDLNINIPIP
jgi:hypothetical protein